ncbi:MAG: arsenate reductase ArsC [Alphaproteobacteria bacterium]|nr:arsenate reductase ArsC [Alphaproteobacteria bacterium]
MSPKPLLVLFLSTGNAARSIVAEALLNAKGSHAYRARSAGIAPAEAIDPETRFLLESACYDTQKLYPKKWEDFYAHADLVKVDIIVTLSEEARELCPLDWPGSPVRVHWNVDDPLGSDRADVREWKLRKCLTTLETRIGMLVRCRPNVSEFEMLLQLKAIGMAV